MEIVVISLDDFFSDRPESRQLFDALVACVNALGPVEMRVSKSQIAFRRRKAFAWAWVPGKYLRGKTAPLVLTLSFRRRDPSPRWKEIVEPARRFTHHLEIFLPGELDEEVKDWLRRAWAAAV